MALLCLGAWVCCMGAWASLCNAAPTSMRAAGGHAPFVEVPYVEEGDDAAQGGLITAAARIDTCNLTAESISRHSQVSAGAGRDVEDWLDASEVGSDGAGRDWLDASEAGSDAFMVDEEPLEAGNNTWRSTLPSGGYGAIECDTDSVCSGISSIVGFLDDCDDEIGCVDPMDWLREALGEETAFAVQAMGEEGLLNVLEDEGFEIPFAVTETLRGNHLGNNFYAQRPRMVRFWLSYIILSTGMRVLLLMLHIVPAHADVADQLCC